MNKPDSTAKQARAQDLADLLDARPVVLVGMMGAGKTTVGRRLAARLDRIFRDSDEEIERAAHMDIPEFFARHGEAEFRAGETRVISRLLKEGPIVLATGGGAFIHSETREEIKAASISVWIKAESDVLFSRVTRRANRPLLKTPNPRRTLETLIEERYPIYAEADVTVVSRDVPQDAVATEIVEALLDYLTPRAEFI